ncbi:hypothetical protein NKR23_g573 [Pleurostoma richardsiae]|uniref:Restriction of telomere capping protein 4 n=1 Tax=Pleurostoma richardsiae TaxID=41990 RepID=A0AA38SF78_9PEZI|nr:hypothetical protein NKR23_g573 [Pleurostoma richardsiae]
MLQSFSKKPRMSIGQQTKFCRMHKKKEAEEEWHSRGYPEIRWDKLESRIADHRRFLANLIEGGASHSADLLERNIKTGKSRTLFKTEESLTPGYYGLRGLRAMTEGIIKQFSALLKKRAVQDRLISARGHTSYVQTVLIPELCVEFIREDMRVDEKSARAVMKESRALGDLLNDDKGDTVHKLDEDSDEQVIGDRGNGRLDALDGEESDLSSLSDV